MLPRKPKNSQNFFDFLVLALDISCRVRVLYTQDKAHAVLSRTKIVENRRPQVAYVHIACWGWGKSIHCCLILAVNFAKIQPNSAEFLTKNTIIAEFFKHKFSFNAKIQQIPR